MLIFKSGKPKLLFQADRLGYNYKSVLDSIPKSFNEKIGYIVWTFGGEMMSIQGKNKYSITKMEVALSTWEIGWSWFQKYITDSELVSSGYKKFWRIILQPSTILSKTLRSEYPDTKNSIPFWL